MKVFLYNAISLDGFIAGIDDDTSWVNDDDAYFKEANKAGAVITGRKTYDPGGEEYTVPDCKNYVYTSEPEKYISKNQVKFISGSPESVLEQVAKDGYKTVLVVGGGEANRSFLGSNLIEELILDIHPVFVNKGTKLFGEKELQIKIELLSTKQLDHGVVQNRYKVVKD